MKKLTSSLAVLAAIAACAAQPEGDEWQNNQKLSAGREPVRAAFASFSTFEDALKILPKHSDRQLTLDSDSDWHFHWSKDPDSRPREFYKLEYGVENWPTIKVPCSWQAWGANGKGGWGTALYVNSRFPFRADVPGGSKVMLEPPRDYTNFEARNPVGSYRRDFKVPADWAGDQLFLKFDGVDSFFYLWVNGEYVGFSKDSRTPAEFDVTKFLHAGKNTVALEVYRYSDGSYFECQDMFRLSGIFRSTWLIRRPAQRIHDFFVTAKPVKDGDYAGDWKVNVECAEKVSVSLCDFEGNLLVRTDDKSFTVHSPKLWSAETPNCYKVVLSNGKEFVSTLFGFRVSEIRDGRYYLNGQKIKLKGANRHETHPMFGHYCPDATMEKDIELLKGANCNAVRNSHYVQPDYWYYLCNTKGIYLVDEANVESHGYGYGSSAAPRQPSWTKSIVARNLAMVERNKNHPAVVIWSHGNESGPGIGIETANREVRQRDPSRPTHYERQNAVADIDSTMYPGVEWVQRVANDKERKRPFYLCEYAHNMLNAMGNLKDYQDAIESSDVVIGATIWDWVDQGLYKTNAVGQRIIAFGGDFGDRPNDGQFVMNGCILSDRTAEPGLDEIRHVFQNWSAKASDDFKSVIIRNKHYFLGGDQFTCEWTALRNGEKFAEGTYDLAGIQPQAEQSFPIDAAVLEAAKVSTYFNSLRLTIKRGKQVVATDQLDFPYEAPVLTVPEANAVVVNQTEQSTIFEANGIKYSFDRKTGLPHSMVKTTLGWVKSELLQSPMALEVFRKPTANELGAGGNWYRRGLDRLEPELVSETPVETAKDGARTFATHVIWRPSGATQVDGLRSCEIAKRELPAGRRPLIFHVASRWTIYADGTAVFTSKVRPEGPKTDLARVGFNFTLDSRNPSVKWFGRGPFENYRDRLSGAFVGAWKLDAEDFFFPYARNESCGNREQTQGVELAGLAIGALNQSFAFEVNPYSQQELLDYVHPDELPKSDKTVVGIYAETRGLGGASCGPGPLGRDIIRSDRDYELAFTLAPSSARSSMVLHRAPATLALPVLPEPPPTLKVTACSSQENREEAWRLVDGDLGSMWHSQWAKKNAKFPHWFVIELPQPAAIKGLRVFQRQDENPNGWVKNYKVEVSSDGKAWSEVAKGALAHETAGQEIGFATPATVRQIRFTALDNHVGNDWAGLAEVEIIQ